MGPLIEERMNVFKAWYHTEALPRLLPPVSHMAFPQPEEMRNHPQLERIFERERDQPVTTKDFDTLILPNLKHWGQGPWSWTLSRTLTDMLPYGFHKFDLARHVFKRCEHSTPAPASDVILQGWSMITSHRCTTPTRVTEMHRGLLRVKMPCLFGYNSVASKTAELLISLAGLDAANTRTETMDAKDARFVVTGHVKDDSEGYPILSWRAAVRTHPPPNTAILTITLAARGHVQAPKR
jgi:hypothetical protein